MFGDYSGTVYIFMHSTVTENDIYYSHQFNVLPYQLSFAIKPIYICILYTCIASLPPSNVTATDICINDATISWNALPSFPLCGKVTYYAVAISSPDGVMTKIVTNTSSFNFTGLMPGNSYNVSVAYGTYAGVGEAKLMILNTPTVEDATPTGDCYDNNIMYVVMWSNIHKYSACDD